MCAREKEVCLSICLSTRVVGCTPPPAQDFLLPQHLIGVIPRPEQSLVHQEFTDMSNTHVCLLTSEQVGFLQHHFRMMGSHTEKGILEALIQTVYLSGEQPFSA